MTKILLDYIHYPVSSGRYMTEAFKRLGHDVRHLGDSTGNYIWGMEVDPKYAWPSNGDLTKSWDDWRPDFVLHMDSAYEYRHPVYNDVPHLVYGVDSHVRSYESRHADHYFLAHKAVSIQPYTDAVEWLPCAHDPVWFTPSPIPWNKREFDVALVGVMYPQRVVLVESLIKAGLKVAAGMGALYQEYRDIYHNARISLCVSAAHDLAIRVFETAALGCAVLTDPLPDLDALNPHGITVYHDADECVELARKLVKNGTPLAEAGQQWAAPHTWDARAARIVAWWQETYGPKQGAPSKRARKGEAADADA